MAARRDSNSVPLPPIRWWAFQPESLVYWGALVRPEDVDDATITEVDQQSFGTVALSNGVTFQNPPAPPQPLPARFRQTADGRWKIRNRDEVRRIRLGDSGAEGRLSRLK